MTASGNAEQNEPAAPTGPAATREGSTAGPQGVGIITALEGTLTVAVSLSLDAADGSTVDLGSGTAVVAELDLAGGEEPVTLDQVPVGAYVALRLVFTSVEADVLSGLLVDGLPFLGAVTVPLPGGELTVVRPVSMEIRENERATLLVDFDADSWLTEVDPLSRTVAAAAFAAEVDVMGP